MMFVYNLVDNDKGVWFSGAGAGSLETRVLELVINNNRNVTYLTILSSDFQKFSWVL